MSNDTDRSSAAITASTGPDRSVPQFLIDIALRALRRGSEKVFLGHESMGYDSGFRAPIGWIMWVRTPGASDGHSELITHQVDCAFSEDELPEWLRSDAEPDAAEPALVASLLELFEVSVKNGWDVRYERFPDEHQIFLDFLGDRPDGLGMRHTLDASASNWGYDQAASDRGERVSDNVHISLREIHRTSANVFSDDGGTHRQVDLAHAEALLRAQAPYFQRVGYFDEEADTWVR